MTNKHRPMLRSAHSLPTRRFSFESSLDQSRSFLYSMTRILPSLRRARKSG
jgi:hypothetical protein